MAEIITCPQCSRKLQLPDDLIGQEVQCPSCSTQFVATADSGGGAAPPPVPSTSPYTPSAPEPPRNYGAPASTGTADDWSSEYDDQPRRSSRRDDDFDDYDEYRPRSRQRRDLMPHRGGTILTLGILSLVVGCLTPICGPMAWVMGNNDMKEIRAGRMDPEGEGTTQAGRICGMIATIIMGCILVFYCFIIMIAMAANAR